MVAAYLENPERIRGWWAGWKGDLTNYRLWVNSSQEYRHPKKLYVNVKSRAMKCYWLHIFHLNMTWWSSDTPATSQGFRVPDTAYGTIWPRLLGYVFSFMADPILGSMSCEAPWDSDGDSFGGKIKHTWWPVGDQQVIENTEITAKERKTYETSFDWTPDIIDKRWSKSFSTALYGTVPIWNHTQIVVPVITWRSQVQWVKQSRLAGWRVHCLPSNFKFGHLSHPLASRNDAGTAESKDL